MLLFLLRKGPIPCQLIHYPLTLPMFHLQHMLSNTPALLSHGIVATCRSFADLRGKLLNTLEKHANTSLLVNSKHLALKSHQWYTALIIFPKVSVMLTPHLITLASFTASKRRVNTPSYVQPCYAAAHILKHLEGQQILNVITESSSCHTKTIQPIKIINTQIVAKLPSRFQNCVSV